MEGDFRLGEWLVQPKVGTITKGNRKVSLEPKVMDVLVYLSEHTDDVLPKEDIIKAVWPDTFVTDEVLTNAISELRKAFQDDAKDPKFIQTLPRRGYRLIVEVSSLQDATIERGEGPQGAGTEPTKAPQTTVLILATALAVAVVLIWYWYPSVPIGEPIDSIAVLPFVSVSDDEDSVSLAGGIPAAISSSLLRLEQLKMVKPASVMQRYQGQEVDPQTVSEEQGVRAVLIGSVERRGDSLAVSVDLVDGRLNALIWGERYSREFGDIFALEKEIAQQVAKALRLELTDEESAHLVRSGTTNPEAYQAFLTAEYNRDRWVSGRLEAIFANAIRYYERAIQLDPNYQEAYHQLSWVHFIRARAITLAEEDYAKARANLEKLIEVDDSTALAHRAKAKILWQYERQWEMAAREYRRASGLDVSFELDERSLDQGFLEWMGQHEESLARLERQLERIDPLSATQQLALGYSHLSLRDYDRAVELANKGLALEPESGDGYAILMGAYRQLGMEEKAFENFIESRRYIEGATEEETVELKEAFRESGWQGVDRWELDRRLKGWTTSRPTNIASLYAGLGEKDKAFQWLEEAWSTPLWGYENAPSTFYWDSLRDDPRFEQLLRKQKLPEETIQKHLTSPF